MSDRTLLLELGVEEIPARFLPPAIKSMEELLSKGLEERAIKFGEVKAHATPRRLAVIASEVEEKQEDRIREVSGPPKRVAFNEDGSPTKTAEKFAASQGVDLSALSVVKKEKGEYVVATVEEKGRNTFEVLPEILSELVTSLHFPKNMRWGYGDFRFPRPLHTIAALFDADVIPLEIEGIKSGRTVRGHRFLAPDDIELETAGDYIEALRGSWVMVDEVQRRAKILDQAMELAREAGGSLLQDPELLETVTHLVEYPLCLLGRFEEKFLELPEELIVTVLKDHQKYFAVRSAGGPLSTGFVVTANTKEENTDTVRTGAERVVRARLEDARFYFEKDRKHKLSDRLGELERVTFQEKLGSMAEKTQRLETLAEKYATLLCPEAREKALEAARLSKCDLVTGVVFEFPELQGIVGRHYARLEGLDAEVAEALAEQYLPGDQVQTDTGAILSLSDKLDTLAGFFSIGHIPSGSEDPFALRRAALWAVGILFKGGYRVSINTLIKEAVEVQAIVADREKLVDELSGFFKQRIAQQLTLRRGYPHDVIQAMTPSFLDVPPVDLLERGDALEALKKKENYNDLLLAFKRVRNIAPEGAWEEEVVEPLFTTDEERSLLKAYLSASDRVGERIAGGDYPGALEELSSLLEPINLFFDKVLVMDKDENIKRNRLALLGHLWALALDIADLSKLEEK